MIARASIVALAAVLAASIAASAPASVRQKTWRDDASLATCIEEASQGRQWLQKTLWGLRDQEAGWIGAQVKNRNGTHDLGPLQINSWWIGRIARQTGQAPALVRHWLTNDPCFNVNAARWIFLSALASTGDYWKAIGVYHSPTASRQRRYALSVADKLAKRFGQDIFGKSPSAGKVGHHRHEAEP